MIVSSLVLALLVNFAFGAFMPNLLSSIAATSLYGVAVALMFAADPVAVWLLFPFILLQLAVLVSLNFIEGGSYILEMGQFGHASTAAVSYSLYSLLLLCVALVSRRAIRSRRQQAPSKRGGRAPVTAATVSQVFHFAFVAAALLCVLYLLFAGLRTGFPLLTHTDRFLYRRVYADVITVNILDLKIIPTLGLGLTALVASSRLLRLGSNLCFVALTLESLLFGDKFFIIFLSLIVFLAPRVVQNPIAATRRLFRLLPGMVIVFSAMLLTTYFIYSDYGNQPLSVTMSRLGDRISGQGELWFMATNDTPPAVAFDRNAVDENIVSLFQRNPADYLFQHSLGPNYFMSKYAAPRIYRAFLHSLGSVTPTMALESYGLALFGYVGLIVLMGICGVLLGMLLVYIQGALRYGNPFLTLIPALLLNNALKFFAQGTFFSIISQPVFKTLGAFLVLEIFIRIIGLGLNRSTLTGNKSGSRVLNRRPTGTVSPSIRTVIEPNAL